jgi:hypothetical protein
MTWDGFAEDHYFPGDYLPYSAINVPLTSTFGAPWAKKFSALKRTEVEIPSVFPGVVGVARDTGVGARA